MVALHNIIARHPSLPGWSIACIPLLELINTDTNPSFFGASVSGIQAQKICSILEKTIARMPYRTLIALDLKGIANMEASTWEYLGPQLLGRVLAGEFGAEKRLVYLVGDEHWLADDLQWAFERIFEKSKSKAYNCAALVPNARQSYCGILVPIYAEALNLLNKYGNLSTLELYSLLRRRYSIAPAHADRCLAALSKLGLIYRQSSFDRIQSPYDLNARGYALTMTEDEIRAAVAEAQSTSEYRYFTV
ncbi:hypothetical protein [Candidatus Chlorohelix sp.]|uniref:hypothetical protein n=1 Tax=Candidatus Chlorohelix sp. TaxID=3139201 RepID=UPI003027EC79